MSFKVFIVKIFTTIWFIGRYRKIFLKVQKKPHVKYFPLLLQKNILEYWAKCILKISYTASIYHIIYKINIQYIFRNYFPFVVPQYDDPMMLNNIIQPNVCDWLADRSLIKGHIPTTHTYANTLLPPCKKLKPFMVAPSCMWSKWVNSDFRL